MVDVRKMSTKKLRPRKGRAQMDQKMGILRGALSDQIRDPNEENSSLFYKIETMGCQMNIADSERIEGQLQSLGIDRIPSNSKENPDVIVLNTCSIRDHAEQKVYS